MTSSLETQITALATKIKGLITTHENKTSSSSQKGHAQAGSTPQAIGTSLSAGTDNGYYARADHVHTVDYDNINYKPLTFPPSSHNHDEYPKKGEDGINLIPYSRDFSITSENLSRVSLEDTTTTDRYENCSIRKFDASSSSDYYRLTWSLPTIGTFKQGDKYTLSFWAKGTGTVKCYYTGSSGHLGSKPISYEETASDYLTNYSDGRITFTLSSSWKRYYVTWELNPEGNNSSLSIQKTIIIQTTAGSTLNICGVMFEKGDYVHDWSPSPIDLTYNLEIKGEIPNSSNSDLNTYIDPGWYKVTNGSGSIQNKPPDTSNYFILQVEHGPTTNKKTQTLYATPNIGGGVVADAKIFYRNGVYSSSSQIYVWSNWREIIMSPVGETTSLIFLDNTDLNNLTVTGEYLCKKMNTNHVCGHSNIPNGLNSSYFLKVKDVGGSYILQKITTLPDGSSSQIYIRYKYGADSWSSWTEI